MTVRTVAIDQAGRTFSHDVVRARSVAYALIAIASALLVAVTQTPQAFALAAAALAGLALVHVPARDAGRRAAGLFVFEQAAAVLVALVGAPLLAAVMAVSSLGVSVVLAGRGRAGWMPVVGGATVAVATWAGLRAGGVAAASPAFGDLFADRVSWQVTAAGLNGAFAVVVGGAFRRLGRELVERERRMRSAQEAHRMILQRTPDPIVLVRGGRVVEANEAAGALLGVRAGDDLRSVLDGDGRAGSVESLLRASVTPVPVPVTLQGPDGPTRHVEFVSIPTLHGDAGAVMLAGRDVTEVVSARAALEESRAELQALFDRLPVALYRSLPSGEVVAANPALARLLGYDDLSELMGDATAADRAYADLDVRREWQQRIERDGVALGFEYEMRRRDGTTLLVSDSAVAVEEDGRVLYEGALVDVTALRVAEESRRRLVAVVEATSDLVALSDGAGLLVYANPALRRFLGLDEHGPLPSLDARTLLARSAPDVVGEALEGLTREGRWRGELAISTETGDPAFVAAMIQQHGTPARGLFYSLVGRDVTEERRTARRLARLVEAKDEFVASVSHELRTPLTAVVGIAHELRDGYELFTDVERRDLVDLVSEQSQEVANIVEDLLVAARADTDRIVLVPEAVPIGTAIEAVFKGLPRDTGDRIEVEGDGTAWADPRRIRQIIRNLVTNALRYGGGGVGIRTTTTPTCVRLEVVDDGDGIPPELWERIFEPFESAHAAGSQPHSVGLGLTISRWLARKMGGDLRYSRDERGSVFTLELPVPD